MKKTKESRIDKKTKNEYKNAIPVEIRVLFGKFYIFSLILSVFLGVGYQFIVERVTFISSLLLLIFCLLFFIYIFIDFLNRKKNFMSTMIVFCIVIYISSLGFAIYKLIMSC